MKRIILLFVVVFCACPAIAQHPDDYRWDERFSLPGVPDAFSYGIKAMASTGDYVVVGGRFTGRGNNIALWNKRTSSWEKAGTGITLADQYSFVSGILAEGNSIIVWGRGIKSAGGKRATGWAMYNLVTKDWETDTRLYGDINSAVRYNGDIVFSGSFTIQNTPIKNIARWNGKEWKEFTSDATQLLNRANLTVWQNRLFAIGRIDEASTTPALLYEWNGTQWERLLNSITITPPLGISDASKLYKIAADKSLYIYGAMDSIKPVGGQTLKCRNIARYDGTSWSSILDTIGFYSSNRLQSMCVVGDDLYIGGDIDLVNGIDVKGVARWSAKDRRWNALGSGIPRSPLGRNIHSIVFDGLDTYAAGQFDIAGAQFVNNIARYSPASSEWSALSGTTSFGLSGRSNVTNDNGQLVVVGSFVYAGTKQVNSLAIWNGTEWSSLGSGILGGTGTITMKLFRIICCCLFCKFFGET